MSSMTPLNPRTTGLMQSSTLLNQMQQSRHELLQTQKQVSSGKAFDRPSDAPGEVSSALHLRQQVSARAQYQRNLEHAEATLNTTDQVLGDATALLREAKSIGASQIGVGSNADTRAAQAQTVDAKLDALMELANRQQDGIALFGGDRPGGDDGKVFESFLGGVRYTGSREAMTTRADADLEARINTSGPEAFGALSARVKSELDLAPQATADTSLQDIDGAQNRGFREGAVSLTVNGTSTNVDLRGADTLGDITRRINDAIDDIDNTAGSLSISGDGFALNANAGNTITIEDIEQGDAAQDLGIDLSATGGTATGDSVQTHLTPQTELSDLGKSVDFSSGLTITQGNETKTIDFSGDTTIQDMMNRVESLDLGVRLEINDAQEGLNLVSEVSGLDLSVGENGGTTGRDLGLLTLQGSTKLETFRHGRGVETASGEDDLTIHLHDGTEFNVNLDGASTVDDVLKQIESAAAGAGLTIGGDLEVGLRDNGAGLLIEDLTGGGDDFSVANANTSLAATHLDIEANASGGNVIRGADQAKVRVENAFTDLIKLRDALRQNDEDGITFAGSGLEEDIDQVVAARGKIGAEAKRVEDLKSQTQDRLTTEETMLSRIEDTDMVETITRFTQLQQQLRASMQVGGQNLQQSLLDFLR